MAKNGLTSLCQDISEKGHIVRRRWPISLRQKSDQPYFLINKTKKNFTNQNN